MGADSRKSECGETPQSGGVICRQPLQPHNEVSAVSDLHPALGPFVFGADKRVEGGVENRCLAPKAMNSADTPAGGS